VRRHDGAVNPVVHLELHTGDERGASAFYAALLSWRPERVHAGTGSYLALDAGGGLGAGIVECGTERALWLPYVAVRDLEALTDRAVALGASVLLGPRAGPAGRRSVVRTPAGGEVAFWEPKGMA
jgi:predicted enzyme related to lactoylglutathione lyase